MFDCPDYLLKFFSVQNNANMTNFNILFKDIIEAGLCTRCGVCAGACPVDVIEMDENAYPRLAGECIDCAICINCCPGGDLNLDALSHRIFSRPYNIRDLTGYVENQYVGYPTDQKIRFAGASGGMVTGLLVYLLEKGKIDGAVVVGMDPETPYKTAGILARTKEEIVRAAQSKYCITPSMEAIKYIRKLEGRFAVVALPCQVHGIRKLEGVDPKLSEKIACILGLYCHCNLNLDGPVDAIKASKIDLEDVREFQFRGGGWPGSFYAINKDDIGVPLYPVCMSTLMNILFRFYGANRCYLCVDVLAEFADLSFGDFWARDYKGFFSTMERSTLVLQRTAIGRKILENASEDGALKMHKLPIDRFSKRTLNMAVGKKRRSFYRLRARINKGLPIPDYHVPLPSIKFKYTRSAIFYHVLSRMFKSHSSRKIALQLLGTPLGEKFDRLNRFRKRHYYRRTRN